MKWDSDRIMSVTAIVVGVGSLFVIVYQTQLMRQAQHASVLPYLSFVLMSNNERTSLMVGNTGIGPALIDEVKVLSQGREIIGDPSDYFVKLYPGTTMSLGVDRVLPGRLIPAGANVQMLESVAGRQELVVALLRTFEVAEASNLHVLLDAQDTEQGLAKAERAVIEVTYSSVYGDRWRIRSDRMVPEPQ
jgi:hypothetical protein